MVGKTAPATPAQKARMDAIAESGCLPCMIKRIHSQATIQHVTEGGRRLGHDFTYGSCFFHHLGQIPDGFDRQTMMGFYGPSFAHGRKNFEQEFGDERDVLVKLQTWVLHHEHFDYHELFRQWDNLLKAN